MTVNHGGGFGFLDHIKVGDGVRNICFDSVKVNRFEAVTAVGFNTKLVRLQQNVNADFGIRVEYTISTKESITTFVLVVRSTMFVLGRITSLM